MTLVLDAYALRIPDSLLDYTHLRAVVLVQPSQPPKHPCLFPALSRALNLVK